MLGRHASSKFVMYKTVEFQFHPGDLNRIQPRLLTKGCNIQSSGLPDLYLTKSKNFHKEMRNM